jgi:hypothetical protein
MTTSHPSENIPRVHNMYKVGTEVLAHQVCPGCYDNSKYGAPDHFDSTF